MTKRVLLVGCGNIGRRHLQALMNVAQPLDVVIVEPNRSEWGKAEQACAPSADRSGHSLTFLDSLSGERIKADLAVIATGAEVRRSLFDALEEAHDVDAYLFEKVLFQTTRDLTEVGRRLESTGKSAWVNCGRRGFPGYKVLRDRLSGRPGIDMRVTGGGWGICSNGIHFLDLYTFVTGHEVISGTAEYLRPGSVPSKREGCIELMGQMRFRAQTGGLVDIVCHDPGTAPLTVEFYDPDERIVIDEASRSITSFRSGGVREHAPFESYFVSEMPFLYERIIDEGKSDLPTYDLSARQHAIFLNVVRGHLGLNLEQDERCPIT